MYLNKVTGWKKSISIWMIFAILSVIIQSPQIFSKGYVLGVDSIFHMNRIYETMMQLKTGDFNYFISLFSYQQSARIVNAFYGPGMSYILGALLLFLGSWVKFQLVTSFLVNIIGAYGIYRIAKKLSMRDSLAILSGAIYMSTYFVASWNIAGSFTGIGNMLIPYVMYYGIEMLVDKKHNFSVLGLGLSMGVLLQTHVFSSLLATLVLLPCVIYAFIKTTLKKEFLFKMLFSIGIAILLSLNVWLGMFYLLKDNQLLQTVPLDLLKNAVYFLPEKGNGQANIGIVLSSLFFFQVINLIINWKNINNTIKILMTTGSIFLLVSSRFFPWSIFSKLFPALESFLQFPSRLIIVPTILLLVTFEYTCKYLKKEMVLVVLGTATFFSISMAQDRVMSRMTEWNSENVLASPNKKPSNISAKELRNIIRSSDLGKILDVVRKGTSDYLPLKEPLSNQDFELFDPYSKYWEYVINPNPNFEKKVSDGDIIVSWESGDEEMINVPIFKYEDTVIKDLSSGKTISVRTTDIGTIQLNANEVSAIRISYPIPLTIKISIFISGITFIICLSYTIINQVKKNI
ncbi:hypothetical protein FJO98_07240 [Enterococcus sp. PF-2]|jgi:hypothetical protein|uniref:hypothetical protein n=1 Tax=Enterococcus TaxID=1350 RepID=UPI000A360875|nr:MULTISPECIES: hypothetical protein [unclassified Enterococcus]MBO1122100.1 hypothetical protein [Enterococcus casseliflavus]MDF2534958.1 hypothetical protein [Bacillales bacterium]MEC5315811.1 hypothetical protein [Enterococcus casseliflavus]OTO13617.1 hypothetical protein A5882_002039 [Enterococcus sp. 4E1_DIV0656]TPE03807.1 hypothetical protein FJP08_09745 [Enterococcus sp. PF-3]